MDYLTLLLKLGLVTALSKLTYREREIFLHKLNNKTTGVIAQLYGIKPDQVSGNVGKINSRLRQAISEAVTQLGVEPDIDIIFKLGE